MLLPQSLWLLHMQKMVVVVAGLFLRWLLIVDSLFHLHQKKAQSESKNDEEESVMKYCLVDYERKGKTQEGLTWPAVYVEGECEPNPVNALWEKIRNSIHFIPCLVFVRRMNNERKKIQRRMKRMMMTKRIITMICDSFILLFLSKF